jgi:hypothetical protein
MGWEPAGEESAAVTAEVLSSAVCEGGKTVLTACNFPIGDDTTAIRK